MVTAACSSVSQLQVDAEQANDDGFTRQDSLDGIRNEEKAIASCMEDKGFAYVPRPAETLVIFVQDGPGYGKTQTLLDAVNGKSTQSSDPNLATVPVGEREAYGVAVSACREVALKQHNASIEAARPASARLEAAWAEFRASSPYRDAVTSWSACMADDGYDFSDPSEPSDWVVEQAREFLEAHDVVNNLGPDGIKGVDVADVIALQEQEIALYDADRACRVDTLDPVVREFKADLFARNADDVRTIRQAIRGEAG